jgi:hypothetical protein
VCNAFPKAVRACGEIPVWPDAIHAACGYSSSRQILLYELISQLHAEPKRMGWDLVRFCHHVSCRILRDPEDRGPTSGSCSPIFQFTSFKVVSCSELNPGNASSIICS